MILELINNIRTLPGCEVLQSIGLPDLPSGLGLPNDVEQFYSHCGGMNLFQDRSYSMTIVSPTQFLRANPEIAMVTEETGDISDWWFIIGKHGQKYVTIDLDPERLGRCYDSF
jgi:hypothetical protein